MTGLAEVLSFIAKNPNITNMKMIKKGKKFFLFLYFLKLFLIFYSLNFLAIKKVKHDDFKRPKEYTDEYLPLATPLNTTMFENPNECLQKVPEPEYLPIATPLNTVFEKVPEHHFFLPKTPPRVPSLSPIPDSPIQQLIEQEIIQQTIEQEINQQTIEQPEINLEQTSQLQYLVDQLENQLQPQPQPQPQPQTLTNIEELQQNMYSQLIEQPPQQNMYEQLIAQTEIYEHQQPSDEGNDVVMDVITETLKNPIQSSRSGKNITMLKRQFTCLQEEEEQEQEEQEEEELRTTTKNNKRFHKHLILKKKDEVVKKFPILSQKNTDLIVTAENKFKELKSVFILKKKYIDKNRELKDHIYGLELIEHRYRCETERMIKKKKK